MINAEALRAFLESRMAESDYYLIDVREEPGDRYVVEIDSDNGVDIDYCVELSREVEEEFPRDDDSEDYELEVGSTGLTSPFKVRRQYEKNIGQDVEVLTSDGRKLHGVLREAGDEMFTVETIVKEKPEGSRRPVEVRRAETIPYSEAKMVRCDLKI